MFMFAICLMTITSTQSNNSKISEKNLNYKKENISTEDNKSEVVCKCKQNFCSYFYKVKILFLHIILDLFPIMDHNNA